MSEGDIIIIIRCSSLSGYTDCARRTASRLFRKFVEGAGYTVRETPRGAGLVVGSACHKAAEVLYTEKAKSGSMPPASLVEDCAAHEITEAVREGAIMYDAKRGPTYNRDDALRQATRMSRVYRETIAVDVEPILVEERLEAEIAPGIILSGTPDVVAREPHGLRDLKTSGRAVLGNHTPQIGGYSLLGRSHNIDIQSAAIDFVQRVRVDKAQPVASSRKIDLAQAETAASNIIRTMERDLRVFREGDPERGILAGDPWAFPANPDSKLCGDKYCPAHGTKFCNEWTKDEE